MFQLYHYIRSDDQNICFVLDQQAWLDFYSASSLKQQSAGRHVSSLGQHFPESEPITVFALLLIAASLAEKQQIHILYF